MRVLWAVVILATIGILVWLWQSRRGGSPADTTPAVQNAPMVGPPTIIINGKVSTVRAAGAPEPMNITPLSEISFSMVDYIRDQRGTRVLVFKDGTTLPLAQSDYQYLSPDVRSRLTYRYR